MGLANPHRPSLGFDLSYPDLPRQKLLFNRPVPLSPA